MTVYRSPRLSGWFILSGYYMKGMEIRMSLKITPVSATQTGKVETAMNLLPSTD